jgi:hypothetical protein
MLNSTISAQEQRAVVSITITNKMLFVVKVMLTPTTATVATVATAL